MLHNHPLKVYGALLAEIMTEHPDDKVYRTLYVAAPNLEEAQEAAQLAAALYYSPPEADAPLSTPIGPNEWEQHTPAYRRWRLMDVQEGIEVFVHTADGAGRLANAVLLR